MQNIALQNLQIYIHMLLARGLQDLGCHSIRLLKKEGLFNTLVFCFSKVWRQVITCNSRVASALLSFESLPPTMGGGGTRDPNLLLMTKNYVSLLWYPLINRLQQRRRFSIRLIFFLFTREVLTAWTDFDNSFSRVVPYQCGPLLEVSFLFY